jgi:endonuclease/exonuclease/phosphatase (EEP) superfamily protein YafD
MKKSTIVAWTLALSLGLSFSSATGSYGPAPKDDTFWDRLEFYVPALKDVMTEIGEPSSEALNTESIKLVVWNMYKGDLLPWERDYNLLSKNADILMLQEMLLGGKMSEVFNEHDGYQYKTAASFIYNIGQQRTGVTTASHVESARTFSLRSNVLEPVINTPKMSIFAFYPLQGRDETLLTVNIHAINFVTTEGLKVQIEAIAHEISNHKGPIVFAGDFNTWSKGKLNYVMGVAKRLGLSEVSFKRDDRMRKFGFPLDHVFVRGVTVKSAVVRGELLGSDHKAMELVFSIH